MSYIAGVDIGNSTTEVCIARVAFDGTLEFLVSASCPTTGIKGTVANVHGITSALKQAMGSLGLGTERLSLIRLNEAAPVIGDTAMETLTETIITDSSMIGHNPSTPAGAGQAVGQVLFMEHLDRAERGTPYILAASRNHSYEAVAEAVNRAVDEGGSIEGMILQADEAVLVENRLHKKIPIIDEVARMDKLPEGVLAAIEVALPGETVRMLSNPYGIATLLKLTPEETQVITPIAKSLVGKRSAVVLKTPGGNVREQVLPAGEITVCGDRDVTINLDEGAEKIMAALSEAGAVRDILGQPDTNVGNMFARIRRGMGEVSGEPGAVSAWGTGAAASVQGTHAAVSARGTGAAASVQGTHAAASARGTGTAASAQISAQEPHIRITDILAVDTLAPVVISGALAGETCLEKAVGIAAMVRTEKLPMEEIASRLKAELGVQVAVAGVEAVMASLGALTTPGVAMPLAILDMGGGSTDAAVLYPDGRTELTHQAGAGELVTMLIGIELGLRDHGVAEQIKKYPLAKVESLFHMRMENGQMSFVEESIDPRFFGRVVMLTERGMVRLEEDIPMEKIVQVRREAKRKVFVTNALRALRQVAPEHDLKRISNVVLVGGSAEDFEIPDMLMEEFANYRIVCGRGNIRGSEGPRNAVATGLVLSYIGERQW